MSTKLEECPYCGQALTNRTAVDHLRAVEERREGELREKVEHEAARLVEKRRGAMEKRLTNEIEERIQQQFRGRSQQQEALLASLMKQNADLERQLRGLTPDQIGHFNESEISDRLQRAFAHDQLELNKRGAPGADILHTVRYLSNDAYVDAGLLVYECKDTKSWSNGFVAQAKAAAARHGTPYVVLVTRCFPRDEHNLAVRGNVLIVDPDRCVAFSSVIRRMVIEIHRTSAMTGRKKEKSEALYGYLASPEFKQSFQDLSDWTDELRNLLSKEEDSHRRQWTRREHLYDSVGQKVSEIDEHIRAIMERVNGETGPRKQQRVKRSRQVAS
jgi:hypothetical protein